jgi:hypothetical protein
MTPENDLQTPGENPAYLPGLLSETAPISRWHVVDRCADFPVSGGAASGQRGTFRHLGSAPLV